MTPLCAASLAEASATEFSKTGQESDPANTKPRIRIRERRLMQESLDRIKPGAKSQGRLSTSSVNRVPCARWHSSAFHLVSSVTVHVKFWSGYPTHRRLAWRVPFVGFCGMSDTKCAGP